MRRALLASLFVLATFVGIAIHQRSQTTTARRTSSARAFLNDGALRAVILGDSVAKGAGDERGAGIAGALQGEFRSIANFGINGARTNNVLRLLADETRHSALRAADVIVISIGGNDLYGDSRARLLSALIPERQQQSTLAKVQLVVAKVREVNPAAHIILLGLYNPYRHSRIAAWLDRQVNLWDARLITRFASMRDVTVVRICDLLDRADHISSLDRFHPGARGYEAIAARIASSL